MLRSSGTQGRLAQGTPGSSKSVLYDPKLGDNVSASAKASGRRDGLVPPRQNSRDGGQDGAVGAPWDQEKRLDNPARRPDRARGWRREFGRRWRPLRGRSS